MKSLSFLTCDCCSSEFKLETYYSLRAPSGFKLFCSAFCMQKFIIKNEDCDFNNVRHSFDMRRCNSISIASHPVNSPIEVNAETLSWAEVYEALK